jgi:hypothetical protein
MARRHKHGNSNLQIAKTNRNDEFYTRLCDIENEVQNYWQYLKGKTIYCPCDNPYHSNFVKYFIDNFHNISIARLVATCYSPPKDLFDEAPYNPVTATAYKLDVTSPEDWENSIVELSGNGDFASEECLELLKQADVVVTNPPFSLFRKFFQCLVDNSVDYLLLGNLMALSYNGIVPHVVSGNVNVGYFARGKFGNMYYSLPEHYECRANDSWEDEDGQKWIKLRTCLWLTSLPVHKQMPELPLTQSYCPERYPHYDNYDAINVDRVVDIPKDYHGAMGVPITYMLKHNPEQFEVLDIINDPGQILINGYRPYNRAIIRRRDRPANQTSGSVNT